MLSARFCCAGVWCCVAFAAASILAFCVPRRFRCVNMSKGRTSAMTWLQEASVPFLVRPRSFKCAVAASAATNSALAKILKHSGSAVLWTRGYEQKFSNKCSCCNTSFLFHHFYYLILCWHVPTFLHKQQGGPILLQLERWSVELAVLSWKPVCTGKQQGFHYHPLTVLI